MKDKYGLSPRTVGIISLIFAAWKTAGLVMVAVALIAEIFTNSNFLPPWRIVPEVVIWVLFLIGGLRLIYGNSKGRFLVMVGAIVSFFTGVVGLILSPIEYLAESISGFLLFGGLLDAGLFYFAWKLKMPPHAKSGNDELHEVDLPNVESKPPDLPHQPPVKTSRKMMFDVAYACFTLIGVTILLMPLISIIPFDYNQLLGMLVLLPLSIVAIPAAFVGAVLSLILWRELPLLLMTILGVLVSALVAAYLIAEETDWNPELLSQLFPYSEILAVLFGLAFLGLTLRWWLMIRKKRTWT